MSMQLTSPLNQMRDAHWDSGHRDVGARGATLAGSSSFANAHFISIGLPCQPCFREDPKLSRTPRGPCITPPGQTYEAPKHACLHGLPVERVLAEVRRAWDAAVQQPETLNRRPQ